MIVKGHTVRSDINTLHKSSKYLSHPLEQTSKVRVKIIVTLTLRNIYIYAYTATSRAARGGGGSFKNRKRIGEIGCCESRMTKRKH